MDYHHLNGSSYMQQQLPFFICVLDLSIAMAKHTPFFFRIFYFLELLGKTSASKEIE